MPVESRCYFLLCFKMMLGSICLVFYFFFLSVYILCAYMWEARCGLTWGVSLSVPHLHSFQAGSPSQTQSPPVWLVLLAGLLHNSQSLAYRLGFQADCQALTQVLILLHTEPSPQIPIYILIDNIKEKNQSIISHLPLFSFICIHECAHTTTHMWRSFWCVGQVIGLNSKYLNPLHHLASPKCVILKLANFPLVELHLTLIHIFIFNNFFIYQVKMNDQFGYFYLPFLNVLW